MLVCQFVWSDEGEYLRATQLAQKVVALAKKMGKAKKIPSELPRNPMIARARDKAKQETRWT